MTNIEEYKFGFMKIDGQVYKNDLVILPGKIIPNWWRKEGHNLCKVDLVFLEEFAPTTLIIGCGYSGMMKIGQDVKEYCDSNNIKLIVEKSTQAVSTFNQLNHQPGVAGAFHLTC